MVVLIGTHFVERYLLPHLMPFNGHNPHSVLVMDNCAVSSTVETIYETGVIVHFLPPYSPDFNPIKSLFSKVKTVLQGIEANFEQTADLETLILTAVSSVRVQD